MTYSVYWSAFASREFGRMEASAADSARIREAARLTDYNLRRQPADMGEGRVPADQGHGPHRRVWFGDVLAVYFRVDPGQLRVEVLAVGPSRRPRTG